MRSKTSLTPSAACILCTAVLDLLAFSEAKFNILILGTGFRNLEASAAHSSLNFSPTFLPQRDLRQQNREYTQLREPETFWDVCKLLQLIQVMQSICNTFSATYSLKYPFPWPIVLGHPWRQRKQLWQGCLNCRNEENMLRDKSAQWSQQVWLTEVSSCMRPFYSTTFVSHFFSILWKGFTFPFLEKQEVNIWVTEGANFSSLNGGRVVRFNVWIRLPHLQPQQVLDIKFYSNRQFWDMYTSI